MGLLTDDDVLIRDAIGDMDGSELSTLSKVLELCFELEEDDNKENL